MSTSELTILSERFRHIVIGFKRRAKENPHLAIMGFIITIMVDLHILKQFLEDIPWIRKIINPLYVWWGLIFICIVVAVATVWSYIIRHFYEPMPTDTPLQALCKARRSKAKMTQVVVDGSSAHYFVYRQKGDHIWVAPEIRYKWLPNLDSGITEQAFNDRLDDYYDSKAVDRLFESVEKGVKDKLIEVDWYRGKDDYRVGPIRVDRANVKFLAGSLRPINPEESRD